MKCVILMGNKFGKNCVNWKPREISARRFVTFRQFTSQLDPLQHQVPRSGWIPWDTPLEASHYRMWNLCKPPLLFQRHEKIQQHHMPQSRTHPSKTFFGAGRKICRTQLCWMLCAFHIPGHNCCYQYTYSRCQHYLHESVQWTISGGMRI